MNLCFSAGETPKAELFCQQVCKLNPGNFPQGPPKATALVLQRTHESKPSPGPTELLPAKPQRTLGVSVRISEDWEDRAFCFQISDIRNTFSVKGCVLYLIFCYSFFFIWK